MAIHGNKSQSARTKALSEFKDNKLQVLVATDIAARGIDIDQLPHVVNYDLPNIPEDYVHRIGRTGRAGATGEAVSLVCVDEHDMLKDIEKLIKQTLPRAVIPGFEPDPNARPQPVQLRSGGPGHRNGGGGGRSGGGRAKPATAGAKPAGGGGGGKPRAPGAPGGGNGGGPRTGGNAPRSAAQHRSGGRGR
jgi:ATP-dependent RNA helicase RhlE